jgi:predicted nuclease of restriction endonuclease-like RecB superfamily
MLTADLAQSWRRGERIAPRYIDASDEDYLQDAARLISIFNAHEGRARRELETALQEYVGVGTDYKTLRGFIKLLMDHCTFEVASAVEPVEIRRALFRQARAHHPLTGDESVRRELLESVARELNCPPETLRDGLYADLPENQKLVEFSPVDASGLLHLYNLAQAQALLYHCLEIHLEVLPQSQEGYRELFSAIKSYRLIHTIKGDARTGYQLRLDGPVSMFHRSQKYGVQMAVFLPALLLCKGWRMRAEIDAGKEGRARGNAYFVIEANQKRLQSNYMDVPPDENPVLEKFAVAWERFESEWTLKPSREVIALGESAFIPDFVLVHGDGRKVYLEVLGFWTPKHLQERLKEFEHAGLRNFILAAWDEIRGSRDPLTKIPPNTIVFKKNLDPMMVELLLNDLAAETK